MDVYRIARRRFVHDLSGEGARLYGGRWNSKGSSILYTSESRSLATVEFLVHVSFSILPTDMCIAEIHVSDHSRTEELNVGDLPGNWTEYPAPPALAGIGDLWKENNETLCMRVPSAVVRNEWNILINPHHPDFGDVRVVSVEEYVFDSRLLRQ